MISTILIDDKAANNRMLQQLLNHYCPVVDVVGTATNIDDACQLINSLSPRLLFLDVEMSSESGFELLSRFPVISFDVIFITAHSQYAVKAFRENALDYLLKPVDITALQEAVQKIVDKISLQEAKTKTAPGKPNVHRIAIPNHDSVLFISVNDILRCESDNVYTFIYLRNKTRFTSTKSIGEYEQLLPADQFFRVHKSHIINLGCIQKYYRGRGGYVIMEDGSQIEVAARRKDDFLKLFDI